MWLCTKISKSVRVLSLCGLVRSSMDSACKVRGEVLLLQLTVLSSVLDWLLVNVLCANAEDARLCAVVSYLC